MSLWATTATVPKTGFDLIIGLGVAKGKAMGSRFFGIS